jgi:hypothetical protein
MQLIKSNSVLIGFKNDNFRNVIDYDFLCLVQSISLSINKNNLITKSIGSDLSNKSQFINPDVSLDITFLQRNDFWNERIFGFNFIENESINTSALSNFIENFSNSSAVLLMSDLNKNDLVNNIKINGFSEDFTSLALDRLYLDKYSISYSTENIAMVTCSFSMSNFNISKLINDSGIKFKNCNNENTELTDKSIEDFFLLTNTNPSGFLVYSAKNFNATNNVDISAIDISTLSNSSITKLDFSIDFNRSKYYFFENGANPALRKLMVPLKYSLNINGISANFTEGDIEKIKENKTFNFLISIGDSTNTIGSYTKLLYENLVIENFNYSLNMQGFLEYSLTFSGEISSTSGFKIISEYIFHSNFSSLII